MALRFPNAKFAVLGQPIAHSLSPIIHRAFAQQWSVDLDYQRIECAPGNLAETLTAFTENGGVGLNITLPHKQSVMALCATLSERAQRAQAVNTLTLSNGEWHGDNTDGAGLIRDLTQRNRLDLRGQRILLLGAGGAAFGVAPLLLDAGIGELIVCNRNAEKARAFVEHINSPRNVSARHWHELDALGAVDLIINATSAARSEHTLKLPNNLCASNTVAVDLSYGEAAFDFVFWAKNAKCAHAIDGLGMLVEQAAESFYLWQGVRPETEEIFSHLQQQSITQTARL